MSQPVSITGPVSSILGQSQELLLGAAKPPWSSDWNVSAEYISNELHNGSIPYTNIAALAFKVITFYAKDAHAGTTVVWSSAHEVFELLKWMFVQAFDPATEQDAGILADYLSTFDTLIDTFCLPPPAEAIVWIPQNQCADDTGRPLVYEPVQGDFGFNLPSSCIAAKVMLPAPGEVDDDNMARNLTTETLREAGFADSTINTLLKVEKKPPARAPDNPFNYL